jgi:hypothetical protein
VTRDPLSWAGRARLVGISALLLVCVLYLILGLNSSLSWDGPWSGPTWAPEDGRPIGRDFIAFWSAARLALDGDPGAAYDIARIHAVQGALAPHAINPMPWHYPPTFLMLVLPLGLAPYPLALLAWLVLPMAALMGLVHHLRPGAPGWGAAPLLALIFPATAQCLISGQTGVAAGALLLGGALLLDRRPVLSGVLLGLLSCKPQLALLVLPALLCGGNWRALLSAAATAAALAGASLLVLGPETWIAFLRDVPAASALLESGAKPWDRMPTIFAAASLLGLDNAAAWLLQGAAALGAASAVCWTWRRHAETGPRLAILAAAIPLATPFLFDYDLVIWLFPLAWLAGEGLLAGWHWAERGAILIAWFGSVGGWLIAWWTGFPAMPAVALLLFAAVLHRLAAAAAPHRQRAAAPDPVVAPAGR